MEDRQVRKEPKKNGLILTFTCHGKGKATSAIGITMRKMSHDFT